jgi:UDP-N-acetylmuramyl pentapeptide synthase
MEYLTDIVRPDIGVVTAVSYAHIEYFGSVRISKRETGFDREGSAKGLSVLNFDNDYCREMADSSQAR